MIATSITQVLSCNGNLRENLILETPLFNSKKEHFGSILININPSKISVSMTMFEEGKDIKFTVSSHNKLEQITDVSSSIGEYIKEILSMYTDKPNIFGRER